MFSQPAGSCPTYSTIHTLPRSWTLLIWDRPCFSCSLLPDLISGQWEGLLTFSLQLHFPEHLILGYTELRGTLIAKGPQIRFRTKWKYMKNESAFVQAHISSPNTSTVASCPILKLSCERIFFKKERHLNVSKSISSFFSSSHSWIVAPLPPWVICFLMFTTSDMAFDYVFCVWKWTHQFSCR